MAQFNDFSVEERSEVIAQILSAYPSLTVFNLMQLISLTDVKGTTFINIKNYSSNVSNNTEVADCQVLVGASYENMIDKDAVTLENINLAQIDVTKYNYKTINTNGKSLEDFQNEVKKALSPALAALKEALLKKQFGETAGRTDNNVFFNKVLLFNTNTNNLSIRGQIVKKTERVEGTFKMVKSAPITVAKNIINNMVNARTNSIRTYNLTNISECIRINGNEINIL